ncbi:MAG TPA: insulinase family protein [Rhizobiales bacterium]|nr:insulinase family protein [Hyphomicrobiales bacterium]
MSVQTTAMANGMRVVTHPMPHLETASLGVWVGTGARCEGPGQHGISHLLEHMAFKGTHRRSAREIAEEIESAGGELNAATSLETTAYYARMLKDDIPLAIDMLGDIVRNPKFDAGELAREQDVILQEITAAEDSPDDEAYDLVQDAAFTGQALGRTILGTKASVRGFTSGDLAAYMKANYAPGAMVLAAAGAVDHDQVVSLAQSTFGDMESGDPPAPAAASYRGGFRRSARRFEQSHIVLSYEGPSYRDETMYAAQILSSMLGGGMSSRLFQEAREARGLCYSIYSFCWGLSDTGLFGVHAATGSDQMQELAQVILQELEKLAVDLVGDAELARAKAQLKSGLLMSLESSGSRAEQLARQMLVFGKPLAVTELVEKVEAVDREAVRALAGKIIVGGKSSASAVGPLKDQNALERLIGRHEPVTARAAE